MLLGILMIFLVLLWPRAHRRPGGTHGMPEPGCAYVLFEGGMSGASNPERMFRSSRSQAGLSLSENFDNTAVRQLPSITYGYVGLTGSWSAVRLAAASNATPDLARKPTGMPVQTDPCPSSPGMQVILSPALQHCGFHFTVPDEAVTGKAAVARFHVETDSSGRVIHLLAEPCDNPTGARLIETAINAGSASCAGFGNVQVSWGL